MSTRVSRAVVVATALLAITAALTSTAGAVTWHNSGDTAFTAGGTGGVISVTSVGFGCTGATATGTSPSAAFVGLTSPAAAGTFMYTGCTFAGNAVSFDCAYTLTATAQHQAVVAVTTGAADLTCMLTQSGSALCRIEGQTPFRYSNPTAPGTFGRIELPHSSTLRATDPGMGATCILGGGEPVTSPAQTFTITSATGGPTAPHLGPVITRTV